MRDRQIRVEDNRQFTKNPVRGSVVNVDNSAFSARKRQLAAQKTQQQRLDQVEQDVAEIKDMLKQLLER